MRGQKKAKETQRQLQRKKFIFCLPIFVQKHLFSKLYVHFAQRPTVYKYKSHLPIHHVLNSNSYYICSQKCNFFLVDKNMFYFTPILFSTILRIITVGYCNFCAKSFLKLILLALSVFFSFNTSKFSWFSLDLLSSGHIRIQYFQCNSLEEEKNGQNLIPFPSPPRKSIRHYLDISNGIKISCYIQNKPTTLFLSFKPLHYSVFFNFFFNFSDSFYFKMFKFLIYFLKYKSSHEMHKIVTTKILLSLAKNCCQFSHGNYF